MEKDKDENPQFLKTNNEHLNQQLCRPLLREINPEKDDIGKETINFIYNLL